MPNERIKGLISPLLALLTTLALCAPLSANADEEEAVPAEIALGERLFLETRFSQHFAAHASGDANALTIADPVMDVTETVDGALPGPFAGLAMNCRGCHLVDEHVDTAGGGMRTYADFAIRSPLPGRSDGRLVTARNSPALVGSTVPATNELLLHFDGEFNSIEDLVEGTLTDRNYGWLPSEQSQARRHIAHIIRNDNGLDELAQEFGGIAYPTLITGTDPAIPEDMRLPAEFRVDVATASDAEILHAVAKLIAAYVNDLRFSSDETGAFNLSPYDAFLIKNNLPRQPGADESPIEYSRRLLGLIESLNPPHYVLPGEGEFAFHDQAFQFGPTELEGLKIFLREPEKTFIRYQDEVRGGIGNCLSCHAAPHFTDFQFHNTGTAQQEYDTIHGEGAFAHLRIPFLYQRNHNFDAYLPATEHHPDAKGPFLSVPSADKPGFTDLGLWNVFANPDKPEPQEKIWRLLCERRIQHSSAAFDLIRSPRHLAALKKQCRMGPLLNDAIALFKTPGLRDLGHSAPYMHTGQKRTLEEVVVFYRDMSLLARASQLRNGAPELKKIALNGEDISAVVAFLKALNEDYE